MSQRALAPVDQITQTAMSISVQNLSSRLAVPKTRDELQRLSQTHAGSLGAGEDLKSRGKTHASRQI